MRGYFKYLAWVSTSWALESSNGAADDILVGGQAVIEGVMMRSPQGYAVTVRRQDGTFQTVKENLPTTAQKWRLFKLPVFRGVGILGQALVLGIRALRFSVDAALADAEPEQSGVLAKTSPEKVSSWLIAGNLVLALAVNIALFVALPLFATRFAQTRLGFESALLFNGIDGVFRITAFVTFLAVVARMKDMRRVFQYHGAEHKTVYTFEARESLNTANARKFSTLHPRCGTSFLLVVMIVSIAVFSVAHFDALYAKLLSRIALLPLVAGLSYEVIRFSAKRPAGLLRLVTFPGLMLQKITTKEPDEPQLETAIRALEEALTV
ncbi:MAG TPA: DUF1385 domain-containing protein [Terriglobia bacterium]|nr:DUF1385 domain-containing protein [Terriglobia bacterium]